MALLMRVGAKILCAETLCSHDAEDCLKSRNSYKHSFELETLQIAERHSHAR